jgi:hypothetical protein
LLDWLYSVFYKPCILATIYMARYADQGCLRSTLLEVCGAKAGASRFLRFSGSLMDLGAGAINGIDLAMSR